MISQLGFCDFGIGCKRVVHELYNDDRNDWEPLGFQEEPAPKTDLDEKLCQWRYEHQSAEVNWYAFQVITLRLSRPPLPSTGIRRRKKKVRIQQPPRLAPYQPVGPSPIFQRKPALPTREQLGLPDPRRFRRERMLFRPMSKLHQVARRLKALGYRMEKEAVLGCRIVRCLTHPQWREDYVLWCGIEG